MVRDDNVAREVLRVAPADEPMQIEILVDNSQAATEYIRDLRLALPEFVDALLEPNAAGRKNEVGLVALGERPTILTEPTFDRAQLKKGLIGCSRSEGAAITCSTPSSRSARDSRSAAPRVR